MRDIRLPETSDKLIDISDINEDISGIFLAYKYNIATATAKVPNI